MGYFARTHADCWQHAGGNNVFHVDDNAIVYGLRGTNLKYQGIFIRPDVGKVEETEYQWQKNGETLTDGGHYSGCTTATLTVTGADTNDEANYSCVVTGDCGTTVSNAAGLSLEFVTNGNFEADTVANPPTGWTTYLQSNKSGNWTIQTYAPAEGTQYQQTQVYNNSCWGGVRQNVTGLAGGTVYTISGSYRTNSGSSILHP